MFFIAITFVNPGNGGIDPDIITYVDVDPATIRAVPQAFNELVLRNEFLMLMGVGVVSKPRQRPVTLAPFAGGRIVGVKIHVEIPICTANLVGGVRGAPNVLAPFPKKGNVALTAGHFGGLQICVQRGFQVRLAFRRSPPSAAGKPVGGGGGGLGAGARLGGDDERVALPAPKAHVVGGGVVGRTRGVFTRFPRKQGMDTLAKTRTQTSSIGCIAFSSLKFGTTGMKYPKPLTPQEEDV
jgi:hypothetical protein